jgi:hypothetical protein
VSLFAVGRSLAVFPRQHRARRQPEEAVKHVWPAPNRLAKPAAERVLHLAEEKVEHVLAGKDIDHSQNLQVSAHVKLYVHLP